MRFRSLLSTIAFLFILTAFIAVPMVHTSPVTYGPRLDEIIGRYIESPAAQLPMLYGGEVDFWPDIRGHDIIRDLQDDGFTLVWAPEAFVSYRIDFNVRDQWGNGTHVQCKGGGWAPLPRGPVPRDASYYTYLGTKGGGGNPGGGDGYAPLDDQAFRHALATLIPRVEIESECYGTPTESVVPPAQKAWHNPAVDGHPYSRAEAIAILEAAGYVFDPWAPNPVPKYQESDPDGNWIDPFTGEPMNYIQFAGVTQAIAYGSWGRDDLCAREFRAIGLPIEHVEVDYGYLTDTMMDYFQFDMYSLGWRVGRFPDYLYGFFHSSNNFVPEGYNVPGVSDPELDTLLNTVNFDTNLTNVRVACFDAQNRLAQLCVSIPTVTRPLTDALVRVGDAAGSADTLTGVVIMPGYGSTNDWTFYDLHWESLETPENPLGIGGTARYIVPSEPTNYHPGYASTTDEWSVIGRLFDGLININPYTHEDIPWLALDWTVEAWTDPQTGTGMNTTFWLRDDVYFHDGKRFNGTQAKWSLEFARDQQIARALPMWQNLTDIEVLGEYTFSVYHNATSPWTFYHVAGPDVWLVNDAACWATMFPQHIYEGTDREFRPEVTVNPYNPDLFCLVGTGPFVYRGGDLDLGGYVSLTAFRSPASPVGSYHWFMSAEEEDALLTDMFHWIGDVGGDTLYNASSVPPQQPPDGDIDIYDLANAGHSYGLVTGETWYNEMADINPETPYHTPSGLVDIFDISEVAKNFGKKRKYPAP